MTLLCRWDRERGWGGARWSIGHEGEGHIQGWTHRVSIEWKSPYKESYTVNSH